MKTDEQLRQDVLDELCWDPEVEETKIGVTVSDGAVVLSGFVTTYAQKTAARRAAERVEGVRVLVDKTEVRLTRQYHTSDEGLAQRIAHVLTYNLSSTPHIKAEVKGGVVTLKGEIDWHYQRNNILSNIEHVSGVISVVDLMKLKPSTSTADIQGRIAAALKRHADIEASNINVAVHGGTVTLSGTVDSLAEMQRVERTAWAAPGVTKVIDNLRVA
jgi:osmotically-inducible protein OsmY